MSSRWLLLLVLASGCADIQRMLGGQEGEDGVPTETGLQHTDIDSGIDGETDTANATDTDDTDADDDDRGCSTSGHETSGLLVGLAVLLAVRRRR